MKRKKNKVISHVAARLSLIRKKQEIPGGMEFTTKSYLKITKICDIIEIFDISYSLQNSLKISTLRFARSSAVKM